MSAIDRAFIRAYEIDEPTHATPPRMAPAEPDRSMAVPVAKVLESIAVEAVEAAVAQPRMMPQTSAPRSTRPHVPTPSRSAAVASASQASTSSGSAGPTQRRPLSAFAQSTQTVEARFKPALEVDSFRWSAISQQLVRRCRARLQPAVAAIFWASRRPVPERVARRWWRAWLDCWPRGARPSRWSTPILRGPALLPNSGWRLRPGGKTFSRVEFPSLRP
jgi:hypothetical protein